MNSSYLKLLRDSFSQDKLRSSVVPGYILDRVLSDGPIVVYRNDNKGELVVIVNYQESIKYTNLEFDHGVQTIEKKLEGISQKYPLHKKIGIGYQTGSSLLYRIIVKTPFLFRKAFLLGYGGNIGLANLIKTELKTFFEKGESEHIKDKIRFFMWISDRNLQKVIKLKYPKVISISSDPINI